jgi:hypothetical protein
MKQTIWKSRAISLKSMISRHVIGMVLLAPGLFGSTVTSANETSQVTNGYLETATGREVMEAVYERHQQYPFVYEEQSMILVDRRGNRETRKLRRYSRVDETGRVNLLLLFDSPADVKGVAMLGIREPSGDSNRSVYLPAFGRTMIASGVAENRMTDESFLGTDFSIENLTGEVLDDYSYIRRQDLVIDEIDYYVIDVYGNTDNSSPGDSEPPLRRHYVMQDTLFITRTDHLDDMGRIRKQQTHHDLHPVHGDMWRADMMLMNNQVEDHRTIIKIDRRVFSPDYIPEKVFTEDWLYANQPPLIAMPDGKTASVPTDEDAGANPDDAGSDI